MSLVRTRLEKGEQNVATQVRYECFKAFNKLIRLVKPSTFAAEWDRFFALAWGNLLSAKDYIEQLGSDKDTLNLIDEDD